MTNDNSLLAHLAWKFTNQTEELATEALGYILSQSVDARVALVDLLRSTKADVSDIVRIETQVSYENGASRPDLVGFDVNGIEAVIFEVKFWAEFARNQISGYFTLLPEDKPSALLIIGPEVRREMLWDEIGKQVKGLGTAADANGIRSASVDDQHWVMLTSWRVLLDRIEAGSLDVREDVRQLQALCDRQDGDAFLPIQSGEFSPSIPRRMLNLHRLVDDSITRASNSGFVSTKGLRVTPQWHGYGRWIRLGNNDSTAVAWFGVHYHYWATEEDTPIWLYFSNDTDTDRIGYYYASFTLPTGVEYDAVLDSIVDELREIAEKISTTL